MKKILIEGMSGNLGGVETFVHLLYSVLKDHWQVDFLTVDEKIPFEEEFQAQGCRIYRITPRYRSVRLFREDIDRVFSDTAYNAFWFNKTTLSSVYSICSARKHGVGMIIVHSHQSKNMGNFLTFVMHKANRLRIGRLADVKAACSQVAARWFFGKKLDNVEIFPNAVDPAVYEPDREKQLAVKKMLGLEDTFLIGNVARFAPEKNHDFLLDIFAEVVKRQPSAHLILCGIGPLLEDTRKKAEALGISDRVSFLGMRQDMPQIYGAMDVFLLPSLFEGLPFTMVEAQASGIPCVVSDAVSREAKLTDLVEYVPLEAEPARWAEQILKWEHYEKVSQTVQLSRRGFTVEAFREKVYRILEGEN